MLRKLPLLVLLLFFGNKIQSQEKIKGDRNVIIKETEVGAFNKIVLSEKFDVILVESNSASVEVETDSNLHDIIQFEVRDSVLSFKTTSRITSSKKLEIKVRYTQDLGEIELLEGSEISALSALKIPYLKLKTRDNSRAYLNIRSEIFEFIANGKSKSRLNIESSKTQMELNDNGNLEALVMTDSLKVNMFYHSNANLEGSTKELKLNTFSSSEFIGKNLATTHCTLNAEDTSDATVNVTSELILKATGNSDINVYGNAKILLETFKDTATLQKKEL